MRHLKKFLKMDVDSAGWNGFSEEDLRKIKAKICRDCVTIDDGPGAEDFFDGGINGLSTKKGTSELLFGVKQSKKKKHSSCVKHNSKPISAVTALQPDQMLSPPKVTVRAEACEARQVKLVTVDQDPVVVRKEKTTLRVKSDGRKVEVVGSDKTSSSMLNGNSVKLMEDRSTVCCEADCNKKMHNCECDDGGGYGGETADQPIFEKNCDKTVCNTKKVSLEEFQLRQKMIEEQNKQRRAMLTNAIAARKKKTEAETEKLSYIQKELQRLDSLVSNDVAILRDQIEMASVAFNEAQKKYEKAEREFVEAKMELYHKMERKERLTEHLCTIIEDNELRKAKKLVELMAELELESIIEECENNTEPVLPQLCSLNDVAYACCTTLHDPHNNTVKEDPRKIDDSVHTLPPNEKIVNCNNSHNVTVEGVKSFDDFTPSILSENKSEIECCSDDVEETSENASKSTVKLTFNNAR